MKKSCKVARIRGQQKLIPRKFEKVLVLPVPMRDSKLLLKLARLRLQSDPPPAAIIKMIAFRGAGPAAHTQRGLFLPAAPEPEKLELTMARLANLVGDANVGSPQLMDTHRPDAIRMERFRLAQENCGRAQEKIYRVAVNGNGSELRIAKPANGFRFFRPGLPARVELRDGFPARDIFSRAARRSGGRFRAVAHFGRLVAGALGSGGVGCGSAVFFDGLQKANVWKSRCARAGFILFITMRGSKAGFCGARTIDVHRIACAFGVQFSGGSIFAGRIGGSVRGARDGSDGGAGPRRNVWRAALLYGRTGRSNIRALIGAEVTSEEGWRYPLLVESRAGYQNICRLITRMKMRAKKGEGQISRAELAAAQLENGTEGLICLTGGDEGPLAHALAVRRHDRRDAVCSAALRAVWKAQRVCGIAAALFREEEVRNQRALEIARKLKLPVLATNGVCHALPEQRELLDVFSCVRHHRTLATAGRLLARNAERHLKSSAAMEKLFADLPEAIGNTQLLASRLQFSLNDLGYQFPIYPVPDGRSQMQFLRDRTHDGMLHRYGADNERARKQIAHELDDHRKAGAGWIFPDRLGHYPFLRASKIFWCRDAARRPTARCAMRWELPRWIRWAWSCCLSDFCPKSAASGRTSISICPAATSASAPFNMCTSATENLARP